MRKKLKVAFVCVHNSCRSQIAEALGKRLAADVFDCYSAGTETKPEINRDAVRIMKDRYGIDMEKRNIQSFSRSFPPLTSSLQWAAMFSAPIFRAGTGKIGDWMTRRAKAIQSF